MDQRRRRCDECQIQGHKQKDNQIQTLPGRFAPMGELPTIGAAPTAHPTSMSRQSRLPAPRLACGGGSSASSPANSRRHRQGGAVPWLSPGLQPYTGLTRQAPGDLRPDELTASSREPAGLARAAGTGQTVAHEIAPHCPDSVRPCGAARVTPFGDLQQYVSIPRVTGLRLSPDGTWLAVTVQQLDPDGRKYSTGIWRVPAGGARWAACPRPFLPTYPADLVGAG